MVFRNGLFLSGRAVAHGIDPRLVPKFMGSVPVSVSRQSVVMGQFASFRDEEL